MKTIEMLRELSRVKKFLNMFLNILINMYINIFLNKFLSKTYPPGKLKIIFL